MGAGKGVNANVLLFDPVTGERHFLEQGDVPSEELRDQLGEHLFVAADDDSDEPDNGDGPPPRAGKGSGRDAWAAYAAQHGLTVEDDQSRDDIVAALEAAGVVEPSGE